MLTAAYDTNGIFPDCLRREPRTNMFVIADLAAETGADRVKVRNMSPGGAMVEGAVLPPVSACCYLSRAGMSLRGEIVWNAGGRAGLRFDDTAVVAEWLPSAARTQADVDRTIAETRHAVAANAAPAPPSPVFSKPVSASDAAQVADALEALADDLATDAHVVMRHMNKLQALDLAVQTLRKIAASHTD